MYDYIFFDLDGTITDSGSAIMSCVRHALAKYGIEEPIDANLRRFIGPPLVDSFMDFYGFDEAQAKEATAYYREKYSAGGMYEVTIYDGIEELLQKINESGKKCVLATSKPEEFAVKILQHFNLDKYFTLICGATMDETRNKKHQVIEYAVKKLGIADTSKVIMIGDTAFDVYGSRKNNIDCIGVTFGFGTEEELREAEALFIVDSAKKIFELL